MATFAERFCKALEERNIKAVDLARKTNIPESVISQYKKGMYEPKQRRTETIAKALNVSVSWLMGADVSMETQVIKFNSPEISEEYIEYPVIGDVAAGFDKIAIEDWTEEKIKIHPDYIKGKQRDEYFVLRIIGDSMYPMYLNGDKVLIKRQNTIDYSGQVAVVIYGEGCGTIKKVEYKRNCISLVPINPQYTPENIYDIEMQNVQILGVPKLLIREIDN